jgi:hypothetical protein
MSHFFFFALGFGCAITGCWVRHQLQEIGIALADNNDCDEHEGLSK